jgi:hypothetical protein
MRYVLPWCLASPCIAATALLLAIVVVEQGGGTFAGARIDVFTPSEAVFTQRRSLVMKAMSGGASLNVPYPVRAALTGRDASTLMTPLEAAVTRGDLPLLQFLEREGALRDPTTTAHLVTLAREKGFDEIVTYLSLH